MTASSASHAAGRPVAAMPPAATTTEPQASELGEAPQGIRPEGEAGDDVVEARHRTGHPHQLEGSGDAEPRDLVSGKGADRLTLEADLAAVAPQRAGDQVEGCRLAGAVRPDQAE